MNASRSLLTPGHVAQILRALEAAVAARIKFPPTTGAMILYICVKLRRIARAFESLATQLRAGTYVALPARARRATARGVPPPRLDRSLGLPCHFAWLCAVVPCHAACWAYEVRRLLSDPETAAMVWATPRLRRILRPLCWMLGVEARLLAPPRPPAGPDAAADSGDRAPRRRTSRRRPVPGCDADAQAGRGALAGPAIQAFAARKELPWYSHLPGAGARAETHPRPGEISRRGWPRRTGFVPV